MERTQETSLRMEIQGFAGCGFYPSPTCSRCSRSWNTRLSRHRQSLPSCSRSDRWSSSTYHRLLPRLVNRRHTRCSLPAMSNLCSLRQLSSGRMFFHPATYARSSLAQPCPLKSNCLVKQQSGIDAQLSSLAQRIKSKPLKRVEHA
jgi:hypothetical protein